MRALVFALLLAACSSAPIERQAQPLTIEINGTDIPDWKQLDPLLKSGSDIQFRVDTTTLSSADGFSWTTRPTYYAYSIKLGKSVDLTTFPTGINIVSSGVNYTFLPLIYKGVEGAP